MTDIIASVSGVRGITGDNLTPFNISKFTLAFAEFCNKYSKSKKIIVGRDGRLKGDVVTDLVTGTLILAGFEPVYIGVVPTPTVQIAVEDSKAAGGISVTASHNPQQWNGLKFLNQTGRFLDPDENKEFLEIADEGKFSYADISRLKKIKFDDTWIGKHIDKVLKLKFIDPKQIKKAKLTVVVDAVNSAGSIIAPKLLKKLGCKVIELYCDGSGIFPHTPEPIPENLTKLSKAVKKYKADIGVAIDPDSDRLVLINEKGEPFIEENTIVMAVNFLLKKKKNLNVSVNLSTTRAVDDVVKKHGGNTFRSAVGEINVVNEMMSNGSVIGGEGSGGIILPEVHYGRDAIVGLALIIQELAESGMKLSEYKKDLPQYSIVKAKIENVKDPTVLLRKISEIYSSENYNSTCKVNTVDGVKLDFPEYWIHLRKSNTEPIIRIITEAKTKALADQIQNNFIEELKDNM
ncbi:phosphoglucosamine mutase [soil metagenome]